MKNIDVVCLCQRYDIIGMWGGGFRAHHPWINLLRPEEVSEPKGIRHAIAFSPGPDAFGPYPNLAVVHGAGAGVDALLAHPGLRENIALTRVINPEQARMMAAFAAYFVTGWHRRMWDYPGLQAARDWTVINLATPADFQVGLLGYGAMGKTIADVLTTMGFPVTALAGSPRRDGEVEIVAGEAGLARITGEARAVINVLPLTETTRGILNASFFASMREDAILIQLGRGGHLGEDDLIAALDKGRPALAALDVMAVEPLPQDHPFWGHPKIMLTPHVASESDPDRIADWVAANIQRVERGEAPEGLVDRSKGY